MALKILPDDVRSMLSASSQISNYKKAVEELVYNSLDAESTSIAIRVHIPECRIQVVDNGYGISKNDFDFLGQRYMTSKLPDLSTLRSIPKYYGYRGEFLANIIEISENVKIASRHKEEEDTWAKIFSNGRNANFTKMTTRPSKGTTVDISGFLYNLNIQKQGINIVNDLQNIKSFLEQLSLVHNDISLSLRDDSRNEIIFKIHKKRDIYQTLTTLFNIEKPMVQELHIEKNQYKIKGLIGKLDTDVEKYWVFLNGKFINNGSKVHKIINGYLKKYFDTQNKKISKSKNNHENQMLKKHIPFYFIFIMCPYIDYDLNSTLAQSMLQFKNWDQIKIMLEKFVKFYVGDINLKEISKPENKIAKIRVSHKDIHDNQDQIKKIIDRILGKNSKTSGSLQLQNGVKGEFIKRKKKNNVKHKNKKSGSQARLTKQTIFLNQDNNTCLSNNGKVSQKQHIIHTNKDDNDINKEKEYSKTMAVNKIYKNQSSNLPKIFNKTFNIKKNKKEIKKTHNNMSRKKTVRQKHNDPELLFCNNDICDSGNKTKLLNGDELIKITEPMYHGSEQKARAKSILKQINNIHNTVQRKEYNFIKGMNDYRKRSQHRENRWDYNLDCIRHKFRTKPFKTTYDLVNTILGTQHESNFQKVSKFKTADRKIISIRNSKVKPSIELKPPQNGGFSNYMETDSHIDEISLINKTPDNVLHCNLRCEHSYCKSQFTNIQNTSKDLFKKPSTIHNNLKLDDIFENISSTYCPQNAKSNYLSNNLAISTLTYKSHNYNTNTLEDQYQNINNYQNQFTYKPQTMRFITNQSRDNFTVSRDLPKSVHKNYLQYNNQGLQMFYKKNVKQSITVNKSYTIEYTSNETRSPEHSKVETYYVGGEAHYTHETHVFNYEPVSGFGNTYIVSNHCPSSENNTHKIYQTKYADCNALLANNTDIEQNYNNYTNLVEHNYKYKDNIDFVFLSDTQDRDDENVSQQIIQPLDVCQTVYHTNNNGKDFSYNTNRNEKHCEILYDNYKNNFICPESNRNVMQTTELQNKNRDDMSHHFSSTLNEKCLGTVDEFECNISRTTRETNINQNINSKSDIQNLPCSNNEGDKSDTISHFTNNNFDLKNRLRFIPKGMSQIFDKCGYKTASDYNLEEEYYSNVLYNDFATDVQMQSEIYEPKVQNVAEFSTKDINKFKNKIHKENTSLSFDERSLNEAQILNQVDSKFIAALIKEKYKELENASEFLVLFDQHAVHERIRLENNLADYFIENKWTSTALDTIKLKLSRDEIIYLHNYKNKFDLLGLKWTTVNDNEILLTSIPEAILGKSPREVDKIMKAVKNLIMEEINIIKLQKGCISLYPKSIMDLVFSEACRYAIKFGDKLSKNDCIQLIKDLSNCKTPFQCAHGRPVMAVIFEIKSDMRAYKVDPASLHKFRFKT